MPAFPSPRSAKAQPTQDRIAQAVAGWKGGQTMAAAPRTLLAASARSVAMRASTTRTC